MPFSIAAFEAHYPDLYSSKNQLGLLCLNVALVGMMVGIERSVVPIYGASEFTLSHSQLLYFIVAFSLSKGAGCLVIGELASRKGRRFVLLLGWILGLPVFCIIVLFKSWNAVIIANIFLGLNQGLCWSVIIIMMMDHVEQHHDGLIIGVNQFFGYISLAFVASFIGYHIHITHNWPQAFSIGIAFAFLGVLVTLLTEDTIPRAIRQVDDSTNEADLQSQPLIAKSGVDHLSIEQAPEPFHVALLRAFTRTTFGNIHLFATCQAGYFSALKDGIVWGLMPLFFTSFALDLHLVSFLIALYPFTWAIVQLFSGTLYDKYGAKWLVSSGLWIESFAILYMVWTPSMVSDATPRYIFLMFCLGSILLGIGTGLMYPTLHVAIAHGCPPQHSATAIGIYKLWRELGYACGALMAGWITDAFGSKYALTMGATLVLFSGFFAYLWVFDDRNDPMPSIHEVTSGFFGTPQSVLYTNRAYPKTAPFPQPSSLTHSSSALDVSVTNDSSSFSPDSDDESGGTNIPSHHSVYATPQKRSTAYQNSYDEDDDFLPNSQDTIPPSF